MVIAIVEICGFPIPALSSLMSNSSIGSDIFKCVKICAVGAEIYLSDNSPGIVLQDKDLCPLANVEIPSFLEILLSSSLFRATLLTSIVKISCFIDLNIS